MTDIKLELAKLAEYAKNERDRHSPLFVNQEDYDKGAEDAYNDMMDRLEKALLVWALILTVFSSGLFIGWGGAQLQSSKIAEATCRTQIIYQDVCPSPIDHCDKDGCWIRANPETFRPLKQVEPTYFPLLMSDIRQRSNGCLVKNGNITVNGVLFENAIQDGFVNLMINESIKSIEINGDEKA